MMASGLLVSNLPDGALVEVPTLNMGPLSTYVGPAGGGPSTADLWQAGQQTSSNTVTFPGPGTGEWKRQSAGSWVELGPPSQLQGSTTTGAITLIAGPVASGYFQVITNVVFTVELPVTPPVDIEICQDFDGILFNTTTATSSSIIQTISVADALWSATMINTFFMSIGDQLQLVFRNKDSLDPVVTLNCNWSIRQLQ
jgi:hypothetical protein